MWMAHWKAFISKKNDIRIVAALALLVEDAVNVGQLVVSDVINTAEILINPIHQDVEDLCAGNIHII
jgi:hypothetical protein